MVKWITFCSFDNEEREYKKEFKTQKEARAYLQGFINDRSNPFRLETITKARFEKWEYIKGKEPKRRGTTIICLGLNFAY